MDRYCRSGFGVFAVVLMAGLTACSEESDGPHAVDQWHQENLPSTEDSDIEVAMSSVVSAGVTREDPGHVGTSFGQPVTISGVEFSCYGSSSMTLSLEASVEDNRDSSGTTTELGPLDCEQGSHSLEVDLLDGHPIDGLEVRGYDNEERSAWVLTIPEDQISSE